MAIILRLNKGSELTFAEVDGNFSSLFYSAAIIGTNLNFYTYPNVLASSVDLSVIPGFGGITVQDDGTTIINGATGLNFTGTGVTVTANGNIATVDISGGGGGGDTYTLAAGAKAGTSVPLNLDAAAGADSTVNLTEGTGITLTQTSTTEVTIDATAGGTYTNLTDTPLPFPSAATPNIPENSTFNNKTFPEMMDLMLYPELNPTLTPPSSTFAVSPNSPYQIINANAGALSLTFTTVFNQGLISPQYTATSPFRSGTSYQYVYGGTGLVGVVASTVSPDVQTRSIVITAGVNTWTSRVDYNAGVQPFTNKNNPYETPLPAGSTSVKSVSITGVYPVFATVVAIATLTQLSLQSMTTYIEASMVAETSAANKQTIDIPQAWATIVGLQQFNNLSGEWDIVVNGLDAFPKTSITRTIEGNTVDYFQYVHNGSIIGARQLRFTT